MVKIYVEGAYWQHGSGWSHTEPLDPMEIDADATIEEIKALAHEYAKNFAGNMDAPHGDDYQLRFYDVFVDDEDEEGADIDYDMAITRYWVSDFKDADTGEDTYTLQDRVFDDCQDIVSDEAEAILADADIYTGPYGGMGKSIDRVLYKDETIIAIHYDGKWLGIPAHQHAFISHELSTTSYDAE